VTSLSESIHRAFRVGLNAGRLGETGPCPYTAAMHCDAWAQGRAQGEQERLEALAVSPAAAVEAFRRDPARLHNIQWRDEAGKLVARPLAATCTLIKRGEGGMMQITVSAADAVAAAEGPPA
jgi:hypothetical protein